METRGWHIDLFLHLQKRLNDNIVIYFYLLENELIVGGRDNYFSILFFLFLFWEEYL